MLPVNRTCLGRKTPLNISRFNSTNFFLSKPMANLPRDQSNESIPLASSAHPIRYQTVQEKLIAAYRAARANDNQWCPSEDEFIELREQKLKRQKELLKFKESNHSSKKCKPLGEPPNPTSVTENKILTSESKNVPLFGMSNGIAIALNSGNKFISSDKRNSESSHHENEKFTIKKLQKNDRNRHLRSGWQDIKINNVIIKESDISEDEVVPCSQKPIKKFFVRANNDCSIMYHKGTKPEAVTALHKKKEKEVSSDVNIGPQTDILINSECNPGLDLKLEREDVKSDAVVKATQSTWQVSEISCIRPDKKMSRRKKWNYRYVRKLNRRKNRLARNRLFSVR